MSCSSLDCSFTVGVGNVSINSPLTCNCNVTSSFGYKKENSFKTGVLEFHVNQALNYNRTLTNTSITSLNND